MGTWDSQGGSERKPHKSVDQLWGHTFPQHSSLLEYPLFKVARPQDTSCYTYVIGVFTALSQQASYAKSHCFNERKNIELVSSWQILINF